MGKYRYLEVEQERFLWKRARGYYWSDDAALVDGIIFGEPEPPYLIAAKGEKLTVAIGSKLFIDFAKLPADRDGILSFANSYGMLTAGEALVALPGDWEMEGESPRSRNAEPFSFWDVKSPSSVWRSGFPSVWSAESLSFWSAEISDMAFAADVWKALNDNDRGFLNRVIVVHGGEGIFSYRYPQKENLITATVTSRDTDPETFRQAETGDLFTKGKILLSYLINSKLEVYNMDYPTHLAAVPQVFIDDDGKIGTYLNPATLIAALWIQLLRAATGGRRYKRCQVCGLWEDATYLQSNWRYHSECASREKQRRYRERLKGGPGGHDT